MFRQATYPLLLVLSPTLTASPGAALERRLRKAALRRQPLVIGAPAEPYDPADDERFGAARSLLSDLLRQEGLEITVTTGTPRILRDLELLVELDKRHAVAVRVMVPAAAPELQLQAVRALAAEGIATTVLCAPVDSDEGEEALRRSFAAASEAGARDVEVDAPAPGRAERERFLSLFRRLRLEHGFPRETAGRG